MIDNITLEVSLKPFKKTDDDYIRNVCSSIFEHWRPLCKNKNTVSVMFWTADGSEILEYNKDLEQEFEWCQYIGNANSPLATEQDEREEINAHIRKRKYIPDPPIMTYGILKRILEIFREEARKAFPNTEFLLGETFDLGPEFAVSDFKYRRHPEICSGTKLDSFGFVDSTALLNADSNSYASYPDGIPQDTPLALFLGKQTDIFLRDMGFDYLWLSNGMGFSAEPWDLNGKIYDGKHFYPKKLEKTKNSVCDFWRLFREGCPDFPIRVRGTNNTVGIDYATDGVPLYDIYAGGFNISSIPNSPWAALNDDYGLEIAGHMTRICELPCENFMFRYYLHDPWWHNSPWYDRYDGVATDIYLPMSISRITEEGKINNATALQILTVDNSFGNMPDSCVYEVIPHILKADNDASDEPAPLVWVYPLKEYTTLDKEKWLKEMYFGDSYIKDAINSGLPLNCVVSSDNYLKHSFDIYKKSILITPVQPNKEVNEKLIDFASQGGRVIFYGSKEMLSKIKNVKGIKMLDICNAPSNAVDALSNFDIEILFICEKDCKKVPTMTINRNDGAMLFSVYNSNTTTETRLHFPLGAPILLGGETKIVNGFASYHFSRCEHRECRIFVEQDDGVISLHEYPPLNPKYRRRIRLDGLKNATVYFFPENYCKDYIMVSTEAYPDVIKSDNDNWIKVESKEQGVYYKSENVNGVRDFLFIFPDRI